MSFPKSATSEAAVDRRRVGILPASYLRLRASVEVAWQVASGSKIILPLLLMTIAFGLYLPRLAVPEKYLFDEILFAYTAGQYAEGDVDSYRWDHPCSVAKNRERCAELYPEHVQPSDRIGRYQWAHPPMGKMMMVVGIKLFGNDAFGWRIMSVVAGAIGVAVAYQLGLMVTGKIAVGLLTATFLLLDGMYFTYSRMGLTDIFLVVFTLSSIVAFTWYLRSPPERQRIPLLLTGFLLGMGIATKWSAAYGAFFIGVVIVWRCYSLWWASRRTDATPEVRLGLRHHLVWGPVALVVFPVAIYLAAYLPFFIAGNNTWSDFIALQKAIIHIQTTLENKPRTSSEWWTWPLDMRSVWFGTHYADGGRVAMTFALGNPFLYWMFLPAIFWTLVRWWRSRQMIAVTLLLIGFFAQWLPWALIERPAYLYHFLPMVPFGCLALAATVVHICSTMKDWRRTLAVEYVVLVAAAFVFFFPIVSYMPLTTFELALRQWFDSWK